MREDQGWEGGKEKGGVEGKMHTVESRRLIQKMLAFKGKPELGPEKLCQLPHTTHPPTGEPGYFQAGEKAAVEAGLEGRAVTVDVN